jgi:hypothetical protein
MMESIGRGVLDTPLSRSMTACARSGLSPLGPRHRAGHDSWAAAIAAGRTAPKRPFFCCEGLSPCYKPAVTIMMVLDEVHPKP